MSGVHVEVHPGWGKPGVMDARDELVLLMSAAAVDVVGDERVSIYNDRGCPALLVTFDDHTKLQVTPWPFGPEWGLDPSWHMSTTRGGRPGDDSLKSRPDRWDSEAEMIVRACWELLLSVEKVRTP